MNLAHALKVHLRVFDIHRTILRVVTLRPQTTARLSTNNYHGTWHILAGPHGAMILGRLLYGLSFQRQPGTVVLVHGEHLSPNPFDADPGDPILLIPDGLTAVDIDVLRILKLRLRRMPGRPITIRWHTFGMRADIERERGHLESWQRHSMLARRERLTKIAGFICYTAPPAFLRSTALSVYAMHDQREGYDIMAKDPDTGVMEGEFQIVPNFNDRLSAALAARREILGARREIADWDERIAIWERTERLL